MSDIVIVGGGVAGLAAALSLRHHRPILLEPSQAVDMQRYYALGEQSVSFLRQAGVQLPPLVSVQRFELYAGGVPLPLQGKQKPLCYIVAEGDLLEAMSQRVAALPVQRMTAQQIHWQQTTKTAVNFLADGQKMSAKLLVAADGGRSPLAMQMGVLGVQSPVMQKAVVATVRAPLQEGTAAQWFASGEVAGLLPLGNELFCLIWSTVSPPPPECISEQLKARLGVEVEIVGDVKVFPIRPFRRAVRVAPRTAFVGDASGVIHPLAGHGVNLALHDATSLAICVRQPDVGASIRLAAYAASSGRFLAFSIFTDGLARYGNLAKCALMAGNIPIIRQAAVRFANR